MEKKEISTEQIREAFMELINKKREELDILLDVLNSMPANSTLRKGSPELKFDAKKIAWMPKEGPKGAYEMASESVNRNEDYAELKRFLTNCGGNVTSEGYYYWMFPDERAIGRKKK